MLSKNELQIKLGNATEKFICKTLRKYGYWAYNIPKKVDGQPCDIIGIKGNNKGIIAWLVDAKHVEEEKVSFSFDRIEPNQKSSFEYARGFANIKNCGFVVFFERTKSLYWFPYESYKKIEEEGLSKSVNLSELELFEEMLKKYENED